MSNLSGQNAETDKSGETPVRWSTRLGAIVAGTLVGATSGTIGCVLLLGSMGIALTDLSTVAAVCGIAGEFSVSCSRRRRLTTVRSSRSGRSTDAASLRNARVHAPAPSWIGICASYLRLRPS
jgi:hypothetical protein